MSKVSRAQAAISTHEKICEERYGNIDSRLSAMQTAMAENQTQSHSRFNKLESDFNGRFTVINNRLWAIIISSLMGSVGGLAALVFYLLTKDHK